MLATLLTSGIRFLTPRHSTSRPTEGRENKNQPQAIYQTGKKAKSACHGKDYPGLKGSKYALSPELPTAENWPLTKIQHDKREMGLTFEMKVEQVSENSTHERTQNHTNVSAETLELEEN